MMLGRRIVKGGAVSASMFKDFAGVEPMKEDQAKKMAALVEQVTQNCTGVELSRLLYALRKSKKIDNEKVAEYALNLCEDYMVKRNIGDAATMEDMNRQLDRLINMLEQW